MKGFRLRVFSTAREAGKAAAEKAAQVLNERIARNGSARILLSTGKSQFHFFESFVKQDIDWGKVEMFHLDEYIGIDKTHPASFNKYLTERFVSKVPLKKYYLIDGKEDPQVTIRRLTEALKEAPIDLGMVGIGENTHIAFNDHAKTSFLLISSYLSTFLCKIVSKTD